MHQVFTETEMKKLKQKNKEKAPFECSDLWDAIIGQEWTAFDVRDSAESKGQSVHLWLFEALERSKKSGIKTGISDGLVIEYLFNEYKIRQPHLLMAGGCLYFSE